MMHFPQEREILKLQARGRLSEIEATVHRAKTVVRNWETVITGERRDVEKIPESGWEPFAINEASGERPDGLGRPPAGHYRRRDLSTEWGWWDRSQWFRASVTIPAEMAGWPVVLLLDPGAEALCYINGVPAQGLDPNRNEVMLTENASGGETFGVLIEASATPNAFDDSPIRQFHTPYLAIKDMKAWDFYWDMKVWDDISAALPEGQEKDRIQLLVDQTLKMIDLNRIDDLESYHGQLDSASSHFQRQRRDYEKSVGMGNVVNVGHSHIDTAWLWPLRETRKKCSRTFATVLKYMERYPHYTFTQGQPQLYEWVREHYPDIWNGIQQKIADGQWEPNGGSWVEQDSNVAGSEALVRQYLYGRRYFKNVLGKESTVAWLPDAFGFPITMPQILRKAGIKTFGTTKINWSQYNRFPYHTFRWRGLDGTEVFSIMPPGHYNGVVTPSNARTIWNDYLQKDCSDYILNTYGHGDGGGGPTLENLENLKRLEEVTGLPRMEVGNLQAYAEKAMEDADWERLPVYHDELYLELHRGCQTTQARTKRNNRKSELLARDAEFLSALATLDGEDYPQDALMEAWKPLLTNQFHDILPGSSVNEVYEDADTDYARIIEILTGVRDTALSTLDSRIDTAGDGQPVVVRNTLGWVRTDVARLPVAETRRDSSVLNAQGEAVASQVVTDLDGQTSLIFEAHEVPAMGHAVYRVVDGPNPVKSSLRVSKTRLENDFFVVKLTSKGTVRSVYDKRENREVVAENATANELQLFDDRPFAHDAWDVDFNIDENRWPMDGVVSIEVTEQGPVRGTVRVVNKTEKSTLTQDISIWRTIPRIDFATSVDWHEKRRLLKVAFPVDIRSRTATYEVQFGAMERPTHHSTSYDRAKFEVAGHRWIDLSEGAYGVSLLNDCKYGFDTYENTMRISLLRSPTAPDPKADEGHHEFVYSMYPHRGDWREAQTVRRAYELNVPLIATECENRSGDIPSQYGFMSVDKGSVVVDSVKKAEDSDALIVRLYEAHGTRGPVRLSFAQTPVSVAECNLMEEEDQALLADGPTVEFAVRPWEIRTFKVTF